MRTCTITSFCRDMKTIIFVATLLCSCSSKEPLPPSASVSEVVAITVTPKTVPVSIPFVAQTQSSHQVDVVSRVSGFLEKTAYKEGEAVREGQVLFQIDRKQYQAQVDAVRAEVESRKAQVWTARANLDRIKPLAEQNAASKSDLDNATGSWQAAEAGLAEAKARLQKAELELGYTTIKAPISGLSGLALLHDGTYVTAGALNSKLTYVAKINPIWIEFSVSQNDSAKLNSDVTKGLVTLPKNKSYPVTLELSDGTTYPQTGHVNFADPSFNRETGTYLVRAVIPNSKGSLKPGMFVKAYVKGLERPNSILVPQRAVQQSSNGNIVFVVNEKSTAEVRPVVTGDWVGQDWLITSGLKAGDRVIVDGFQKLAPGVPVKVIPPGNVMPDAAGKAAAPSAKPAQK